MKTILEKFRWWSAQIEQQEPELLYILYKIFRSYRMQFELLDRHAIVGDGFAEIAAQVKQFSTSKPFEENARLFISVYRSSFECGLFDMPVPFFDLLERTRKTQYHIWRLFERSRKYNTLVRQYNDRIRWPSRYLVAKAFGFEETSFLVNHPWYHGPSSIRIVGICGASGSGKSTVCQALKPFFDAQILHLDSFFRNETTKKFNGYANWEVPEALMFDRLIECLHQLQRGEPTLVPSQGWTEVFDRIIYPKPVIIVEGFLVFADRRLNSFFDRKIFIEISEQSILDRRVKRNGPEDFEYAAKCVVPNYVRLRPQLVRQADVVINGDNDPLNIMHQVKQVVENCS